MSAAQVISVSVLLLILFTIFVILILKDDKK